jgi:hypothetical protein
MVSSGMLRRVALVTRAMRRNNPEDTILHSHRRENLKSYNVDFVNIRFMVLTDRRVGNKFRRTVLSLTI